MSSAQAKAEIFWLAFNSLPKKEKRAIIEEFLSEDEFREDLLDIAIFAARKNEKARPIHEYLAAKRK